MLKHAIVDNLYIIKDIKTDEIVLCIKLDNVVENAINISTKTQVFEGPIDFLSFGNED